MSKPRSVSKARKTKETDIRVSLNLDGTGQYEIHTGIPFFDHMLAQLARHGHMDLTIAAKGDLEIGSGEAPATLETDACEDPLYDCRPDGGHFPGQLLLATIRLRRLETDPGEERREDLFHEGAGFLQDAIQGDP